jgi:hypothetical protein
MPFPGRRIALLSIVAAAAAAIACSDGGSGTRTTLTGPGGVLGLPSFAPAPANLVTTCDTICDHAVAQCGAPVTIYGDCLSACGELNLVQAGCVDQLASYLACVSGATSIQCQGGGEYVLVSPPSCAAERAALSTCSGGPPVAACVQVPVGNTSCPAATPASGALFCVGQPTGCDPAGSTAFGIGAYCCLGGQTAR